MTDLNKAQQYEEVNGQKIDKNDRPLFHVTPYIGWMNDPNGFCWYNGYYHLFYQYYPYDTNWNSMHWGHVRTKDFIHWEYLPVALAPDKEYDAGGCFSGSAIEISDGRQLLMYTAVKHERLEDGSEQVLQTQALAVGDGIHFEKYEKNPVIIGDSLPKGASKADFRDPKIWKEDGLYYCVVGNRPEDGSGQILLYSSKDAFHWEFVSILAKNENRYGKMWECPDFFELDGKHVLLVSPQDMLPEDLEFHNGNGTLCIIGELDRNVYELKEENYQAIDYGIDFYAPQTLKTPDGRRIMIGWMQNWDTTGYRLEGSKWFSQMSLPRELSIKNGKLYQLPVKELESLRTNKVEYKNIYMNNQKQVLDNVKGRHIDMEVVLRKIHNEDCKKFVLRFAEDKKFFTELSFFPEESILKIDRKNSGTRRAYVHQRRCQINQTIINY